MKRIHVLLSTILISGMLNAQSGEQFFTASGTFTVPADVSSITIEVMGAGGNGGFNGTGGGGGGGFAKGEYSVTPLDEINISIGYVGAGAVAGTTTVSGFLSASGGENGVSVPNPEIGGGGAPGVGTGGNISNYTGGIGGGGYYTYFGGGGGGAAGPLGDGGAGGNTIAWTGICLTPGGDGGIGGGAPAADGGKGAGFTDVSCIVTDPAGTSANYGGGGGGGNGNGGGPGFGAPGYCKITWCDVNVGITTNMENGFSADAIDAAYQWIDCGNGNTFLDGETNQTFTATESGSYAVIVNDGFCIDTSECFTVTIVIDGINSFYDNNLSVFPNPFTSNINIENSVATYNYTLLNSVGQILWTGKNIEQQNFSYLNNGFYFLKVQDEKVNQTISIIK